VGLFESIGRTSSSYWPTVTSLVPKLINQYYDEDMPKSARGFTLVELLVVISIIVILSTIGLTIYSQAQRSARISRRLADLKAAQVAIETYRTQNGTYPDTSNVARSECTFGASIGVAADQVIPGLVPSYMPAMPKDPQMDLVNSKACYRYISDGVEYKLFIRDVPEITLSDLQKNPTLWDPVHPNHPEACSTTTAVRTFAVYSEGARCW
jgi:prepilin-type N-terminal cleavage/methylation domain-containing protein